MMLREFRPSDGPEVVRELSLNFAQENALTGMDASHFLRVVEKAYHGALGTLLRLSRLFGVPPVLFLVAEEDHRLVGTTFVSFQGGLGYLAMVMTDPDHRRRGVASALLDRAELACLRRRRRYSVLDVMEDNLAAQRLYRGRGYERLRRVEGWVHPLPATSLRPPPPGRVRATLPSDVPFLVEAHREGMPPRVREVLPAGVSSLLPRRYLDRVLLSESSAWCTGPPGRPTAYARGTFTTPREPGLLSLPYVAEGIAPEESEGLLSVALDWLSQRGADRAAVTVPEYERRTSALLERHGFSLRWRTDTLVKDLRRRGPPGTPPSDPGVDARAAPAAAPEGTRPPFPDPPGA